jgi:predicted ATPase
VENGTGSQTRPVPFITRVRLKNYKSIASCDVRLGPLTILVGPNGTGKSNFLDALAFLARAVRTTPDAALEERGGPREILRCVPREVDSFTIEIEARQRGGLLVRYAVQIGATGDVVQEDYAVLSPDAPDDRFTATGGRVQFSERRRDVISIGPGRLFLPVTEEFGRLAEPLVKLLVYNFDTETLRMPHQSGNRSLTLGRSGEDIGGVLLEVAAESPEISERLDSYIRAIVPNADGVEPIELGDYSTIALRVNDRVRFGTRSMSDGTLRAIGVLAALFQPAALSGSMPLVGIEEPETALHPAAAGVLFDALSEASQHVQIVATTQSADLLDRDDLDASTVRPVTMRDRLTVIGEVDDASREIAEKRLHTLGELMRGNQLSPKPPDNDS